LYILIDDKRIIPNSQVTMSLSQPQVKSGHSLNRTGFYVVGNLWITAWIMERKLYWNILWILILYSIILFINFDRIRFQFIVSGTVQHKLTTPTHITTLIFPQNQLSNDVRLSLVSLLCLQPWHRFEFVKDFFFKEWENYPRPKYSAHYIITYFSLGVILNCHHDPKGIWFKGVKCRELEKVSFVLFVI
jgi:hypothetical protein